MELLKRARELPTPREVPPEASLCDAGYARRAVPFTARDRMPAFFLAFLPQARRPCSERRGLNFVGAGAGILLFPPDRRDRGEPAPSGRIATPSEPARCMLTFASRLPPAGAHKRAAADRPAGVAPVFFSAWMCLRASTYRLENERPRAGLLPEFLAGGTLLVE